MALEAEDIDLIDLQQTRINRPVRLVAGLTALGLYRHMFEYERPLQVAMALEADRVLSGFGAQRTTERRAVLIVAIRAAD